MKTITGLIEFEGNEYEYRAELATNYHDGRPDHITDLDCADGCPLPDDIDFEALEELALENARLLDWCERNHWYEEDSGGGCSAFASQTPQGLLRITRRDDPSCPQTFTEPITLGCYDAHDETIGDAKTFHGGIDQYLKER